MSRITIITPVDGECHEKDFDMYYVIGKQDVSRAVEGLFKMLYPKSHKSMEAVIDWYSEEGTVDTCQLTARLLLEGNLLMGFFIRVTQD